MKSIRLRPATSVIALAVVLAGAAFVFASDGYTANQATPVSITGPDGVCKKVTNNSATGLSEYIPTASVAEWQSFYTNPPAGVTLASCSIPESIATKSATLPSARNWTSCAANPATNKIYCFGGWSGGGVTNQIVEYTPATDSLVAKTATLPSARGGANCVFSPATNKIYCFGGATGSSSSLNQIVEYDPATNVVAVKSAVLSSSRTGMACANYPADNTIYCFGGGNSGGLINQIVQYNPATDSLVVKSATLPSGGTTFSCAYTATTGKIYCFGEENANSGAVNQVVQYDPVANTAALRTTMPSARGGMSCVTQSATGRIYCFGGTNSAILLSNSAFNQILEYNPSTNVVAARTITLPSARAWPGCAADPSTGIMYCFGGATSGGSLSQIVGYQPPVP